MVGCTFGINAVVSELIETMVDEEEGSSRVREATT
jgi:hypothetical protein